MGWAFLPDQRTALACVEAQAESTWGCTLQSRSSELFAGLKLNPNPASGSSQPNPPDTSPPPRSGMMSPPLTEPLSGAQSTPSLQDTPASLSAWQDNAAAPTMSVTSGPMLPASSEKFSPLGFSSKTSPVTSALALKPCCENYGTWVGRLRLAYSRRKKSALRTKGSGGSAWPTSRAEDAESSGMRHSRGVADTLTAATSIWPTPMAGTPAQNGNSAAGNSDFTRKAEALWPTATGKDADSARSFAPDGARIRANAGPTLTDSAMALWTTPQAHDVTARGSGQKPTAKALTGGANSKRAERGACGPDLQEVTSTWPTPCAVEPVQGPDHMRKLPRSQLGGGNAPSLATVTDRWPTPAARDYKGENGEGHLSNGTGRLHMDQLPNAVAFLFSRPGPVTQPHGLPSSHPRDTWRRLRRLVISTHGRAVWKRMATSGGKRRLNPNFVEWLMGFPPGLVICGFSEMQSSPSAPPTHGEHSHHRTDLKQSIWGKQIDLQELQPVRKAVSDRKARTDPHLLTPLQGGLRRQAEMGFLMWQRHMRFALSQLPTASGPWIWAPPVEAPPAPKQMSLWD